MYCILYCGVVLQLVCYLSAHSIARHVQKHARLFSVLESMDNGKTFRETRDADIPIVVRHFYHYAGWAQLSDTEMSNWKSIGQCYTTSVTLIYCKKISRNSISHLIIFQFK